MGRAPRGPRQQTGGQDVIARLDASEGGSPPAADVAFVRFTAPDLPQLEQFLLAFGLVEATRTADGIYFKGADAAPYSYAASEGLPGFNGLAFGLADMDALEVFAKVWSAPVEPLDGPGHGRRVRLTDPDGFSVEAVVFGEAAPIAPLRPSLPANTVDATPRLGQERRLDLATAQVCRLGHVVLQVSDLRRSEAWYKARFGLLTSDEIVRDDGQDAMAMFLRLDRGATHTDHHSLFLIQADQPAFHHAAFEVRDLDDLMVGHDHLRQAGYQHHKGIGRHLLGGQVFDYWRDPWGRVLEHWTDGDRFDAAWGPRTSTTTELYADLWRSPSAS